MEPVTNILIAVVKQAGEGDEKGPKPAIQAIREGDVQYLHADGGQPARCRRSLQESFVLAFSNLKQLKQEVNFGGWLKRIVVNECIRYSKKKVLWRELEDHHHELPENDQTEWIREISFERVNEEIKKLPQACRTVFNLYALEDYSHKEIAESLGISESTSKSQYHRARQLLRDRILKPEING